MMPKAIIMKGSIMMMNNLKTQKSKESSSIDAEILKDIQAQIASQLRGMN